MISDFNIIFGNKHMSIFFIIIPIIIFLHFYFLKHVKKRALKFGNFSAMKRVESNLIITKNLTNLFFSLIIFTLLILTLMDITIWYFSDIPESDYFLLLDSGASMNARDVYPDRFSLGKDISKDIINSLENCKIGFISFGGSIIEKQSLTRDKSKLIDTIQDSRISNFGTDIGLAISAAIEGLSISNKSKTIILISDGHDTVGMPLADALKRAIDEHIKIFTIGIGTKEGGTFLEVPGTKGIISKINIDNLITLSNQTNSLYINIYENDKIDYIMENINTESKKGYVPYKLNEPLLIIIIITLFFNWLLNNTRFRIFP